MGETGGQRTRLIIEADTKPVLASHIKLRHDAGRGRWIILGPERVYEPDEISVEILKLSDGNTIVSDIATQLAKQYQAPVDVITTDVIAMLQDLADKGVVTS